jgi:hypothetical protein
VPACEAGFAISSSAPLSCKQGSVSGTVPTCSAVTYCKFVGGTAGCPAGTKCQAAPDLACNGNVCRCKNAAGCDPGLQCQAGGTCANAGICK